MVDKQALDGATVLLYRIETTGHMLLDALGSWALGFINGLRDPEDNSVETVEWPGETATVQQKYDWLWSQFKGTLLENVFVDVDVEAQASDINDAYREISITRGYMPDDGR